MKPLDVDNSADAIRRKYAKRFRELSVKDKWTKGLAIVAIDLFVIGAISLVCVYLFQINLVLALGVYVSGLVIIGTRMRSISNIVHECSHNCFVEGKKWNELFGRTLAILLFSDFVRYKAHHKTHHIYTGDYERDLEFSDTKAFDFHKEIDRQQFEIHLWRLTTIRYVFFYVGRTIYNSEEELAWKLVRSTYVLTLGALLACGFFDWRIPAVVILFWFLPFLTALPAIGYLSDLFDHAGLIQRTKEIEKTRNYTVKNPILHWFFFPRNDSYHLLHHLFPNVPTKAMADCHKILINEEQSYRALPHTLSGWIRVFLSEKPNKLFPV